MNGCTSRCLDALPLLWMLSMADHYLAAAFM